MDSPVPLLTMQAAPLENVDVELAQLLGDVSLDQIDQKRGLLKLIHICRKAVKQHESLQHKLLNDASAIDHLHSKLNAQESELELQACTIVRISTAVQHIDARINEIKMQMKKQNDHLAKFLHSVKASKDINQWLESAEEMKRIGAQLQYDVALVMQMQHKLEDELTYVSSMYEKDTADIVEAAANAL